MVSTVRSHENHFKLSVALHRAAFSGIHQYCQYFLYSSIVVVRTQFQVCADDIFEIFLRIWQQNMLGLAFCCETVLATVVVNGSVVCSGLRKYRKLNVVRNVII